MPLTWNKAKNGLPVHNSLVFVEHRGGNFYICVFKKFKDKYLGDMNIFIIIQEMEMYSENYYDDTKDWYRDYDNLDEAYVDHWVYFSEIDPNKKDSK